MKWMPFSFICLLALGGCQAVPSSLPNADPLPSPACYFPSEAPSTLTASVDVLTEWGFSLDASDTRLGFLSASRERELHGASDLYASPHFSSRMSLSVFGGMGVGSRSHLGVGLGGGFGQLPTEVERVSLLWDNHHVRVSRDIRRFDQYGSLRTGRSASTDDFCARFQTALDAYTATGASAP
ncbi:hypothetical protein L0636_10380 [Halomonas janggokensis]|uniref:DUF4136 domain-containing protein n=1 Tax=Vreelandella janggokensis TaxID=370767 RepID=A0ABT4IW95_9GAMM|nr:hypothetical protein [Halomonas janggokensis]MCZ0927710.1 hypothetical protein [Halomonas janggokensis]MCZ0930832.1 hypothetical protein [Halomonas janggokensis]